MTASDPIKLCRNLLASRGPSTYVASVVRNGSRQPYTWTAELLEDLPRSRRPAPFREIEHDFTSLDELCAWLGHPKVKTNNRHIAARAL
jgi:hypothetical protein